MGSTASPAQPARILLSALMLAAVVSFSGCFRGIFGPSQMPLQPVDPPNGGAREAAHREAAGPSVPNAGIDPLRSASDSLYCISSDASDVEVLGWLATHGLLAGEPWDKLFHEPPMTGPRLAVDSSLYVEHWRKICADTSDAVIDLPDSVAALYRPFRLWSRADQDAFVARTWRGALFGGGAIDSAPPPPPPAPLLAPIPGSLAVTYPTAAAQFTIRNSGGGVLTWAVTEPCAWLAENPASGSTTTEADAISLPVTWTAFVAGEMKTCTVTVTSNGGQAAILLSAIGPAAPPPPPPTGTLTPGDFHPRGTFRSPRGSGNANLAWGGGAALAYRPTGNAGQGSLFSSGHAYGGLAVEFTIPAPSLSTDLNALPIAVKLQEWGDLTGGHYATFTDGELKRTGDYCVLPDDRVVISLFDAYGADSRDLATILLSHSTIASPSTLGPWHVGQTQSQPSNPDHYFRTNGGSAIIPAGPAARLGCDLLMTGGERLGGGTYGSPMGPSARGIKSSDLSGAPRDIPRVVLLDWPVGHPVKGFSVCSAPAFPPWLCSADTFTDCAWIEVGARAVVVFLSNNCDGPNGQPSPYPSTSHYYDPSGAGGPNDPGICPGANKGQVCDGSSSAELWAFDPADLERVARGEIEPWDPEPIWVIDLDSWLIVPKCRPGMCGMAWDPTHRRLIFGQAGVDDSAGAGPYDPLVLWYVIEVGP